MCILCIKNKITNESDRHIPASDRMGKARYIYVPKKESTREQVETTIFVQAV